jgi:hypothetical protein
MALRQVRLPLGAMTEGLRHGLAQPLRHAPDPHRADLAVTGLDGVFERSCDGQLQSVSV